MTYPSRRVTLSELTKAERDRFYEFLVQNECNFQTDENLPNSYVCPIRISKPLQDRHMVIPGEPHGIPKTSSKQANKKKTGPPRNHRGEIIVRGTRSRPGLGEGMDRDEESLISPFGKPPPSLWPEAPPGIGDADSQPTCAMYQHSSKPPMLVKRYWRFCDILDLPDAAPTVRNADQISRLIDEVYDARFVRETERLRAEASMTEKELSLLEKEDITFPDFVRKFAMKKFGLHRLVTQSCWNLVMTVDKRREESMAIAIFANFLDETYDMLDLLFFLYARSHVERVIAEQEKKDTLEASSPNSKAAQRRSFQKTPSASRASMGASRKSCSSRRETVTGTASTNSGKVSQAVEKGLRPRQCVDVAQRIVDREQPQLLDAIEGKLDEEFLELEENADKNGQELKLPMNDFLLILMEQYQTMRKDRTMDRTEMELLDADGLDATTSARLLQLKHQRQQAQTAHVVKDVEIPEELAEATEEVANEVCTKLIESKVAYDEDDEKGIYEAAVNFSQVQLKVREGFQERWENLKWQAKTNIVDVPGSLVEENQKKMHPLVAAGQDQKGTSVKADAARKTVARKTVSKKSIKSVAAVGSLAMGKLSKKSIFGNPFANKKKEGLSDVALDHYIKNIIVYRDETREYGDALGGRAVDMSFLDDEDTDPPYEERGDFIMPPFVKTGKEFVDNFEVNATHMLRNRVELLVKEQIDDLCMGEIEPMIYQTFVTMISEEYFPYVAQMMDSLMGQNQDLWRVGWKAIEKSAPEGVKKSKDEDDVQGGSPGGGGYSRDLKKAKQANESGKSVFGKSTTDTGSEEQANESGKSVFGKSTPGTGLEEQANESGKSVFGKSTTGTGLEEQANESGKSIFGHRTAATGLEEQANESGNSVFGKSISNKGKSISNKGRPSMAPGAIGKSISNKGKSISNKGKSTSNKGKSTTKSMIGAPRRTMMQKEVSPAIKAFEKMGKELQSIFLLCCDSYLGVPAKVWNICEQLVSLNGYESMVRKRCEDLIDSVTFDHTDQSELYSDFGGDDSSESGGYGGVGRPGGPGIFVEPLMENDEEEIEVN